MRIKANEYKQVVRVHVMVSGGKARKIILKKCCDIFSGARPASHDRDIGEPKDHYERDQYEDARSRDSWGFHDNRDRRDRLDRDYQQSR
jgi:hypothetical protein